MTDQRPGYHVEGIPQVRRAFDKLGDEAARLEKPHRALVDIGIRTAVQNAPVLTGRLRGSIEGRADDTGAYVLTEIPYAPFPEYGTRYILAHRYMTRGYEAMERAAEPTYEQHVAKAIGSAERTT
jgi:hypothetical protein